MKKNRSISLEELSKFELISLDDIAAFVAYRSAFSQWINDCFYFSIVSFHLFENYKGKRIKFPMHLLEEVTSWQTIFFFVLSSFAKCHQTAISLSSTVVQFFSRMSLAWKCLLKWKTVYCLRIRWFSILLMLIKPAHTLSINAIRSKYHPSGTWIFIFIPFSCGFIPWLII